MRAFLIALVLASFVTLGAVAVAAADPAETQHLVIQYEDNTALIDFCTGEEVSLSGRAVVLRQGVLNDNRGVEVRLEKYMLEGVNASGETVRLHTEIHSSFSGALGGPIDEYQQSAVHSLTLVRLSVGGEEVISDDFSSRGTFHAVVDADGNLRRWVLTYQQQCT
jgi:hypothetical protein